MKDRQAKLVDRVRTLLSDEPSTREVSMFGGRSFMVKDKLVVSAMGDGSLLVRVAAVQHAELTAEPRASQAEMGPGRSMGPGWISVSADAIADDGRLRFWLDAARSHNQASAKSSGIE